MHSFENPKIIETAREKSPGLGAFAHAPGSGTMKILMVFNPKTESYSLEFAALFLFHDRRYMKWLMVFGSIIPPMSKLLCHTPKKREDSRLRARILS